MLQFELSPQQKELQAKVREFAVKEIMKKGKSAL